jgi:hypothetical protein
VRLQVEETDIAGMDSTIKYLLKLASGNNSKTSYLKSLKKLRSTRANVEATVELALGAFAGSVASPASAPPVFAPSRLEGEILRTLENMVPSAGLSYRQLLLDLESPGRVSYRGTAAEIREVLRETLDHFATDEDVMKAPGYRNEEGRDRPTMRQKARFILKSRKTGDTQRKTSEQALGILEEGIAALTRSVYDRGSVATHVTSTRHEIASVKNFSDAVLAELLQVQQ